MTTDTLRGKPFPAEVLISSIRHRIQEHEGMIVFSQTDAFWGCYSRMCFARSGSPGLWYLVDLDGTDRFSKLPLCHILKAFEIVKTYRGGDFEE